MTFGDSSARNRAVIKPRRYGAMRPPWTQSEDWSLPQADQRGYWFKDGGRGTNWATRVGSPTYAGGHLETAAGVNALVGSVPTRQYGIFEALVEFTAAGGAANSVRFSPMMYEPGFSNYIFALLFGGGTTGSPHDLFLKEAVAGPEVTLISATWNFTAGRHTIAFVRDLYGQAQLYLDGAQIGATVNSTSTYTDSQLEMQSVGSGGTQVLKTHYYRVRRA